MTRFVENAEINIYLPGNFGASTPNLSIPQADIEGISINERVGVSRDLATATVNDTDGSYAELLRVGSQVHFRTQLRGGSSLSTDFVGWSQEPTYRIRPGDLPNKLLLDCDGFVGACLDNRIVTNAWSEAPPSVDGANNSSPYAGVVNQIIDRHCPELTQNGVEATFTPFGDPIALTVQQRSALKTIQQVSERAGALLGSDGVDVLFDDVANTSPSANLSLGNQSAADSSDFDLPLDYRTRGDEMATSVRIDAGQGSVVGASQTSQSATIEVTDAGGTYDKNNGNGFLQRFTLDKPQLLRADVYTKRGTDSNGNPSNDSLTVRVQRQNSNGNPVAPGDRGSDIARATVQAADLVDGGYTTFALEGEGLPTDLVFLIEASGSAGHLVGTDGSTNLTYKAFIPIPLDARAVNSDASDDYNLRETSLARRDQDTRLAVKQQARAVLEQNDQPKAQIRNQPVNTLQAHQLKPLDVVTINFANHPIGGEWVVTSKHIQYGGSVAANQRETRLGFTKRNIYQ